MKKMWLLGGVALAAFASPAFAQQATGLYVSAGIGANWLDDASVDVDFNPPFNGVNSNDFDFSFDVGPVGVVALGYDWGFFRAEAELGVRSNNADIEQAVDFVELGDAVARVDGHVRTISAMANALLDFDVGPVTIYGGGGLGLANVELNIGGQSEFDTVFAYQGIAGAAYNISQQLAVTAEYRYFSSFENPDFFGAEGAPPGTDISDFDYVNQSALIGIRYTFAPPAPVVQDIVQAKSYLVFFDFDSSQLTADAQAIVATAAADALAGNSARLDVTGHTDRSGSDAYNQALSIRRATSVQNALIANGVPAGIIVIRGAGESEPLVPTADGVREPQNRRVEVVIN